MMLTNLTVLPGTKLYQQREQGIWTESSEKERIEEIRELIRELTIPITINSGTSTSSVVFEVTLPQDREAILAELDRTLARFDDTMETALHQWRSRMVRV